MHFEMMKTLFNIFSILLLSFLFPSCDGKERDERPILAVSIEPQRHILEQIAGDRYRIVTMMPGGDNPETFEPSPLRRIDVEESEVYFTIGLLPFEDALISSAREKTKFVNTSLGIDLIYDTHSHNEGGHSHTHKTADPHIWTSVRNAKTIAKNMVETLIHIDPNNSSLYKGNYEKYSAHLDSLDVSFANKIKKNGVKAFLVWHPSLSYFAKDYGLEQVSVSSDTKEMSVVSVADVIEKAKEESINVMFYQREFDGRQADMIGKSVGARLKPFSPVSYYWEKELSSVVDELANN